MSVKKMSQLYLKINWGMLLWTVGVVIMMSGALAYSLFGGDEEVFNNLYAEKLGKKKGPVLQRNLSSVSPMGGLEKSRADGESSQDSSMETLFFACSSQLPQEVTFPPSVNHVRLVGENCWSSLEPVFVVNETTGSQGTLFWVSKTRFSTDYLFLEKGKNRVRFFQKKAGKEVALDLYRSF
ncbi:MAG: hypothetical protein D6797_03595 [Bdellovibrio sp.]|nr:MAG: hypothetical protein D6797_03595 [Bdellovibrio sp.]